MAPMQINSRIERLRDVMARDGHPDTLLVTSLHNLRYLTGFTGSAGMLFVLPEESVLVTDGRYETQAAEQLASAGVTASVAIAPASGQAAMSRDLVCSAGVQSLGLEADHVSWARQQAFSSSWFPGIDLVATTGIVEGLRRVKDDGEQARLAEAARIADDALGAIRGKLGSGTTEAEFARLLDFQMREMGASGPSFETIVASGPNAAKPHHRPGPRAIDRNEAVVIDFGARFDGYCSDMTRTVWVDRVDDPIIRRAVEVVKASQAAGVAAVRAGVACADIDRACRQVIDEAGWGDRFMHGTGHGVGLEIHEAPSVSSVSTDTLCSGHVVTVEPGVYLPGIGGVRIEDTVVVTDDGCRPITCTPKDTPI